MNWGPISEGWVKNTQYKQKDVNCPLYLIGAHFLKEEMESGDSLT